MKSSIKSVINSDLWIITKIMQGSGQYRIDARRRFPVDNESSFFSNWGKKSYIDRLVKDRFGKKVSDMNSFQY